MRAGGSGEWGDRRPGPAEGGTLGQSQPGEPGRQGALPDVVVVRKAEINPRAGSAGSSPIPTPAGRLVFPPPPRPRAVF